MVGKMHTEQKIFGINASTKWKYDVFFLPDTDKIFFFFLSLSKYFIDNKVHSLYAYYYTAYIIQYSNII